MALGKDEKVVQFRPEQLAAAGGGPHDPGMEARVAKLGAHIEHIQDDLTEIKSDIRETLIVAALGVAGLMARGFHWIGS